METSVVIMAAGMGSRFKGGIKQLAPVGENGETLLEYSVCDAARAGFDRVIFIIRREIEEEFVSKTAHIGEKYGVSVQYVFQDPEDIPVKIRTNRTKPWGTGHALLAARNVIDTPFTVINSDDYYGRSAFEKVHAFLVNADDSGDVLRGCMVGYILKKSISGNGTVNRAICRTDGDRLTRISEYYGISEENGIISGRNKQGITEVLPGDSLVSMNFFGFTPKMITELEKRFTDFLLTLPEDSESEFIIPNVLGELLEEKKAEMTVVRSEEDTFGMTRTEDLEDVRRRLRAIAAAGAY
ncbi:MAG: sugar phosphate nucleotidyltransferase [Oscillospiraceae bacterium]|nr:sugar phosphate nucleotidyltransferase [Oscillospiraceae bacterium]MDY2846828.1 sugar phosphate nucleotidyltransferase [Oscillospiraceae bacterium]